MKTDPIERQKTGKFIYGKREYFFKKLSETFIARDSATVSYLQVEFIEISEPC